MTVAPPRPSTPAPSGSPAGRYRARHARPRQAVLGGVALAVAVAAGLFFHLLAVTGAPTDSDEGIVGLMALHVAHGDWRVFFWGQPYGGSLDTFLLAPFVAADPGSILALRATSLIEGPLIALVLWRIMRRFTDAPTAAFSAAVAYAFPAFAVVFSSKAELFYDPMVLLGLLSVLLALQISESPSPVRAALWGLVGGLGWWLSPTIVIFALPALAWVFWKVPLRRVALLSPPAVAGALLGAAPWLVYNAGHRWISLQSPPRIGSIAEHATTLGGQGAATIFGLRLTPGGQWILPATAGIAVCALVGAVFLFGFARGVRSRNPLTLLIVVGAVVIIAFIPFSNVISNGRYPYYIAGAVVALLAAVFRSRPARVALLCGVIACNTAWFVEDGAFSGGVVHTLSSLGSEDIGQALTDHRIVGELEAIGATRLYTDYWTGYVFSYLSDEKIKVYSFFVDRSPAYDRAVESSPRPTYLFQDSSVRVPWVKARLAHLGVGYQVHSFDGLTAITPARPVAPSQLVSNVSALSEEEPATLLPPP